MNAKCNLSLRGNKSHCYSGFKQILCLFSVSLQSKVTMGHTIKQVATRKNSKWSKTWAFVLSLSLCFGYTMSEIIRNCRLSYCCISRKEEDKMIKRILHKTQHSAPGRVCEPENHICTFIFMCLYLLIHYNIVYFYCISISCLSLLYEFLLKFKTYHCIVGYEENHLKNCIS